MKPESFERQWLQADRHVLRTQARVICNNAGVVPMLQVWYDNYTFQVNKVRKELPVAEVRSAVGGLVDKYVALGLRRDVLLAIAAHVFNIEVEGPSGQVV